MCLLDTFEGLTDHSAYARVTIRDDTLFCEQGRVSSWVAIEYLAQTIGLYSGVQAYQQQSKPCMGFLLGVRKAIMRVPYFTVGQVLACRASLVMSQELGLHVFDTQLQDEATGEVLCEARLTVLQTEDTEAFFGNRTGEVAA